MTHNIYVSMSGPDRIGLVAAVSASLFDRGGNLRDTSFAVLGAGFEFFCVVELPDEVSQNDVESELKSLDLMAGISLSISTYQDLADQGETSPVTHWIEVIGNDRPGLVALISEVFGEFDANLVRMSSGREQSGNIGALGVRYVTRFEVSIPSKRTGACLAAVDNTAGQLQLICNWGSVRR